MPSPSEASIGAASATAAGSSGSGGGRGRLSNRGSSSVNVELEASSSKRKAPHVQKQLPPMAKKSPSKRPPSSSTTTGSISPSSASSTSAVTSNDDQNQNVRVVARLRPLSKKEIGEHSAEATKASGRQIIVEGQRNFEYDAVFGPQTTQEEVYKATAGDTVEKNIFRGFNVTILAYGQTGAGKSHTMGTAASTANGDGDGTSESNGDSSLKPPSKGDGIIGRAVFDLFKTRASLPNGTERVKVEMSYLEIYNEEARDLMYSGAKPPELHIRDSKSEGVVVRNLSRHVVTSPTDVANLMHEASERRVTASTQMNAVSSRSHAVCTLYVTIAPATVDCDEKNDAEGNSSSSSSSEELKAKLTLVDLAGSERIKRTGAEGARMREGININKGLFVLGQVVSALSELGQQQSGSSSSSNAHIPYRDSKLTRLLQDSLGGNSRTVMVACVSPAESNVEESINTLRYAERARNIKNNATRNVIDRAMSPAEAAALRRENQMLKLQLLQAQMSNSSTPGTRMPATVGVNGALAAAHGGGDDFAGNSLLNGIDVEKLEIVTRLRANITSMETKVAQLEQRSVSSAEDALSASFKADKWRQRYESLTATLAAKGIDLPEEVQNACTAPNSNGDESETLISQLRRELSDLKEQLRDSQTDAEVARAMAAAVIAGDGDLTAAEHLVLAGDETLVSGGSGNNCDITGAKTDNENDDGSNEHTKLSELVAVDGEIGRKEELMDAMTKERECMDALKGHFQSALKRLQEEVDALSSERESLLKKVGGGGGSGSIAGKKRGPGGISVSARSDDDESPERKRMRARIAELEDRIKTLKKKSAEHTKSIRMREAAERKCSQLAAEITADKRRRAGLQKELKELSTQRRQEKKVAQQQAARMLRDSQKMKSELQKVKDQAARQNAVLRRKAAEAVSKQKQAEEKQKKRNNAAAIRSARVTNNNSVGLQRKEELTNWLEKEIGAAISISEIQDQIEEQTDLIQAATMRKNEMAKSKRHESAAALQSLEIEIGTRKSVIDQLEKNLEEVYKSVLGNNAKATTNAAVSSSSSCFVDVSTWQGLTRQEMRLIHTNTFSRLVDVSKESATLRAQARNSHKLAVNKAISEERKRVNEVIMRLKMDHSEAMMTLLESTKESVQHQLRQDLTAIGIGEDGLDETTKASIDAMLASYLSGCERVGQTVKNDLNDVREKHDSMKAFVDQVAKGIIAKNEASALLYNSVKKDKKKAAKKKSSPSPEEESDFDIFEDDDDDDAGAYSDDSDWSPDTPAPKRKKKKTESSKPRDSFSDDDEEHQLAGEKILSRPDVSHEKKEDASSRVPEAAAASSSSPETVEMESLTVAELRSLLRGQGKAVSGRKAELIKRLRATGAGGGTPAIHEDASARVTSSASSLVASTSNTVAAKENFSPPGRSSSTSVKLGTPKSASSSSASSSSSSSSKDQSSVLGRPPRKRPATSARSRTASATANTSASARTSSSSNLTKHARQPVAGAAADILTASAKKRRRRSMTRAVEQMEVEMANIAEERK